VAPEWPICRACGQRHAPALVPLSSTAAALNWAMDLTSPAADLAARPLPLGRGPHVHDKALIRDQWNPWRAG
jgi:hypothetical protein